MPRNADFKQTLCADIDGFSLHAAVRCAAKVVPQEPEPAAQAAPPAVIAAILEQPAIEKILTHLGLQARAPPRAPARRSQLQAA